MISAHDSTAPGALRQTKIIFVRKNFFARTLSSSRVQLCKLRCLADGDDRKYAAADPIGRVKKNRFKHIIRFVDGYEYEICFII